MDAALAVAIMAPAPQAEQDVPGGMAGAAATTDAVQGHGDAILARTGLLMVAVIHPVAVTAEIPENAAPIPSAARRTGPIVPVRRETVIVEDMAAPILLVPTARPSPEGIRPRDARLVAEIPVATLETVRAIPAAEDRAVPTGGGILRVHAAMGKARANAPMVTVPRAARERGVRREMGSVAASPRIVRASTAVTARTVVIPARVNTAKTVLRAKGSGVQGIVAHLIRRRATGRLAAMATVLMVSAARHSAPMVTAPARPKVDAVVRPADPTVIVLRAVATAPMGIVLARQAMNGPANSARIVRPVREATTALVNIVTRRVNLGIPVRVNTVTLVPTTVLGAILTTGLAAMGTTVPAVTATDSSPTVLVNTVMTVLVNTATTGHRGSAMTKRSVLCLRGWRSLRTSPRPRSSPTARSCRAASRQS
ncbi:MAG: hypothetical protein LBN10_04200 [Propionibacteriaceae bacterium]|nr:hypothetical protein [Propionibacteriaceae bacterium]